MRGVWKDIWTSLRAVVPVTASLVAFVLALLGSLWDPGRQVKIGLIWLLVMAFAIVAVVATALRMAFAARRLIYDELPRALSVHIAQTADETVTLLMRRSRLFGINMFVTIYYEESLGAGGGELFERTIGVGQVVNVQENGLIQVRVLREVPGQSELWRRVRNREMNILSNLVAKPSINFNAIGIEVRFDERS